MTRGGPLVLLAALVAANTAYAGPTTPKSAPPSSGAGRTASTTTSRVDPAQAARLQRIMVPLILVMDHPMQLDQVKVGIPGELLKLGLDVAERSLLLTRAQEARRLPAERREIIGVESAKRHYVQGAKGPRV